MREIKFRAYHKYMQQMLVPVKIHLKNGRVTCFDTLLDDNVYQVKIDDTEYGLHTMQYTGLKDKNGKEIYEGDILDAYHNGVVQFYNGRFTVFYDKGTSEEIEDRDSRNTGIEVIGNIYENPDLINN